MPEQLACPDLHWKVTVKADFAFTEKKSQSRASSRSCSISNWKLVETTPQGLLIGGEGQCIPLQIVKVLQVLEEFPPEGCPACANIRRIIDECRHCGIRKIKEGLFEITIPLALIRNPKFKGFVDALKEDERFQSLAAPDLLPRDLTQKP